LEGHAQRLVARDHVHHAIAVDRAQQPLALVAEGQRRLGGEERLQVREDPLLQRLKPVPPQRADPR
jgi:hypothetical protein